MLRTLDEGCASLFGVDNHIFASFCLPRDAMLLAFGDILTYSLTSIQDLKAHVSDVRTSGSLRQSVLDLLSLCRVVDQCPIITGGLQIRLPYVFHVSCDYGMTVDGLSDNVF